MTHQKREIVLFALHAGIYNWPAANSLFGAAALRCAPGWEYGEASANAAEPWSDANSGASICPAHRRCVCDAAHQPEAVEAVHVSMRLWLVIISIPCAVCCSAEPSRAPPASDKCACRSAAASAH